MSNLTIVIITILFSAFFSGLEIAFVSSNKLKIELTKTGDSFQRKYWGILFKIPPKILGTLLLGNNIALVIYGRAMVLILEPSIKRLLGPEFASDILILAIQTLIATIIILITAEFIPKALFRLKSNSILNVFAVPINLFYWIFYPVIYALVGLSEFLISKLFGIKLNSEKYTFSAVDLDNYIREFGPDKKEETEVKQEFQMIQNAIGFKQVKLRECIVPRTEISALEENDSIEMLINAFIVSGHSKILIYKDNIDNIVGFIHTSEIFKNPKNIRNITRSIPIFPETMLAHNVLNNFIKEHKTIAIVVDEFGGTSGIVTLEDIIEEIFGEIEDEHDLEELVELKKGDGEFIFSARHEIDYLNDKYILNLPVSEEYETLGGLIIQNHESIPNVKDEINIRGFKFIIQEASETRVEKVMVYIDPEE